MFTVNLEEALLKQNKNTELLPEELLEIKEYEKLGNDFCDNEIIERLGLNKVAKSGREMKDYIENIPEYLKQFDKDKVFHVSQIKKLCVKYRLRFLPVSMYKGSIDKELTNKISNFEIASEIVCTDSNCFIAAPKKSFRLEAKPKDPLFFCELNNEYFYLIHKWGNDLSIFRKLKFNKIVSVVLFLVGIRYLIIKILSIKSEWGKEYSMAVPDTAITFILSICAVGILSALFTAYGDNWDSKIE